MDFPTALTVFVAKCQSISDAYMEQQCPNLPKSVIGVPNDGKAFVRVVRTDRGQGGSAHCFVAIQDGSNRKLGAWKSGDVFKADGWASPARGARGNIFDANSGCGRMGVYGPAYNG